MLPLFSKVVSFQPLQGHCHSFSSFLDHFPTFTGAPLSLLPLAGPVYLFTVIFPFPSPFLLVQRCSHLSSSNPFLLFLDYKSHLPIQSLFLYSGSAASLFQQSSFFQLISLPTYTKHFFRTVLVLLQQKLCYNCFISQSSTSATFTLQLYETK